MSEREFYVKSLICISTILIDIGLQIIQYAMSIVKHCIPHHYSLITTVYRRIVYKNNDDM